MFPCHNPSVCGVQNHRDGTICRGASGSSSKGSDTSIRSSLSSVTSAGDSPSTPRAKNLERDLEFLRSQNPDTISFTPLSCPSSENDAIIAIRNDGENSGIRVLEAHGSIYHGDGRYEDIEQGTIFKNSRGDYWIESGDVPGHRYDSPMLLESISSDSRHWIQDDNGEDGSTTYSVYDAAIDLRDNHRDLLEKHAETKDPGLDGRYFSEYFTPSSADEYY